MAGMEWFRNIRRGELDNHALRALGRVISILKADSLVLSKLLLTPDDVGDNELGKFLRLEEEGYEGALGGWLVEQRRFRELFIKLDHVGSRVCFRLYLGSPFYSKFLRVPFDSQSGHWKHKVAFVQLLRPCHGWVYNFRVNAGNLREQECNL